MKTTILKASQRGILGDESVKIQSIFNNGRAGTGRPGNFGPLYVFNDDIIGPGGYLGLHPHDNVEVITIMLEGIESHEDDKGRYEEITPGYVQLISSGTGIRHAGGNISKTENARQLQIWIDPRVKNTEPYTQLKQVNDSQGSAEWQLQISPDGKNGSIVIKQDAWLSKGQFPKGTLADYDLYQPGNGVMIYVIDGIATIDGTLVEANDTIFLYDQEKVSIKVIDDAHLQIIETFTA
jgi:redox-sensitive bicupin YhaK (pirin superfamily)